MKTGKSAAAAWMLYLLMVIMLFLFLAPFGIVFFNSLKPLNEILLDPLSLPDQLHFENFTQAWTILNVPKALGNTVLITAVSVFFLVFLTAMSSYWISRHHDAWSGLMEKIIIGSALIPFSTLMLPLIMVLRKGGMINTYTGGILTYVGIGFPLAYLIMNGAAVGIPLEMDEAAMMDGCRPSQTFFKVIFPLMKPTVATVVISDVFWIWNEFQIALILLNTQKLQTLQLAINSMFGAYSTKWDIALPGLIISVVPIIVVFLLLQKHIIAGMINGAVKS